MKSMKRIIIKKLMKLKEVFPTPDSHCGQGEIFRHPIFTNADEQGRKEIMLKSAQWNYDDELEYPWDRKFGFDLSPLLKNKVVLDLGCFTGGRSIAWAERYSVKKMYGIDPGDIVIVAAKMFAEKNGIEAEFTVSFGEVLSIKDEVFDAVLCNNIFEHVQSLKDVLVECKRIFKKKGLLFVVFGGYFGPFEHHLNCITETPFLHYFFTGKELIDVYNEILDERGDEARWYNRKSRDLEPWERGNTINGTTLQKFRHQIKETGWNVYYRNVLPLGRAGGKVVSNSPIAKPLSYVIQPFASLPLLEEVLCGSIVYILEKPCNGE